MSTIGTERAFSVKKAHEAQIALSKKIVFENKIPKRIHQVAAVDVAYVDDFSVAAVAVLDYATLKLEEAQTTIRKTSFPYVPTLLSFREVPPAVQCIRKLQSCPDVFLADGHGYAHPYRCGFACHLGLVLQKPTIGVAKNILVGKVEARANEDVALIHDKGETIGAEIKANPTTRPVYVSVGHMISLKTAIQIVKHCTVEGWIPEPLLQAHKIANAEKRKVNMPTRT
jgi:deoxyribonuclease V